MAFRIECRMNNIDKYITIVVSSRMNRDHTFPPPSSRLSPRRCFVIRSRVLTHPPSVFPLRPSQSLLAQTEQFANIARPNPSRINTSTNHSIFRNSLIMNAFKPNRISKAEDKAIRINTSGWCVSRSFRINTSKKHPGEGVGTALRNHSNIAASRRLPLSLPLLPPARRRERLSLRRSLCRLSRWA